MKKRILITGSQGEVGHGLIEYFSALKDYQVVALDLKKADDAVISHYAKAKADISFVTGSILDEDLLASLTKDGGFQTIFHLAALLSSAGERDPLRAHEVNVGGSVALLKLAQRLSVESGTPVVFVLPSTIAVYGRGTEQTPGLIGKTAEDANLAPITMYGINKLYVENLGRYFSTAYGSLSGQATTKVDFRAVRFPGLISADTVPTGGTSDYAAEMVHAAAQGKAYECFVKPGSTLPFMTMPDAIKALIDLSEAPQGALKRHVYNVGAFSCSAEEIAAKVCGSFADAKISYKENPVRLGIVESWPQDVDDSAARADWNWNPQFNFARAFEEYLIPQVSKRYAVNTQKTAA